MKKNILREAAIEYLHIKHELVCSELREIDLTAEIHSLNKELDGLGRRLEHLRMRRDELTEIIANAVIENLQKEKD